MLEEKSTATLQRANNLITGRTRQFDAHLEDRKTPVRDGLSDQTKPKGISWRVIAPRVVP